MGESCLILFGANTTVGNGNDFGKFFQEQIKSAVVYFRSPLIKWNSLLEFVEVFIGVLLWHVSVKFAVKDEVSETALKQEARRNISAESVQKLPASLGGRSCRICKMFEPQPPTELPKPYVFVLNAFGRVPYANRCGMPLLEWHEIRKPLP